MAPARAWAEGPYLHRDGAGGGKRVSATTLTGPLCADDLAAFAQGDGPDLLRLTPENAEADSAAEHEGHALLDPTVLCAARTSPGQSAPERPIDDPGLIALWDAGGIGPGRRAVMARVEGPKAVLALPGIGTPDAAVFVALGGGGAMLHALHVGETLRRQGLGRALTNAATAWAAAQGAPWIGLAVTEANAPALALYASVGFQPIGRYWYRARRG